MNKRQSCCFWIRVHSRLRGLGSHWWHGRQQLLLAVDQIAGIVGGQLKAVSMSNGVSGTRLNEVTAEDEAVVIDVVDLLVALGASDAVLLRVLCGLDINAVGRTGGCAEESGHAFFQAILIAL